MVYVTMACIQILYVALNSLRMVLMIKGKKYVASFLSMIEIFVYIMGLAIVLNNLESILGVIVYSASYGIGILIGMYVEQKIALGYIALQVISDHDQELYNQLREKGYGVTTWMGQGVAGSRTVSIILARRKQYDDLTSTIQSIDPRAFMISYEPSAFVGGFWKKRR
ncbi:DUF2179 domain-containing protein [Brevibacillus sp. WF146]|uniref:DUF2179 domain-containing protein n=1 Tax=Brevibacillus sp. WF146 TaxID=319501 RepID=UPI0007EC7616|nr:DUF2179 domain-containing protein [Brevibacillus sp. WF146]UYZ12611.1 DUF2179 domain-containing protein [Brevibacillus sp. WF146]